MTSDAGTPLANFGTAFANQQQMRMRRDALDQERAEKENDRKAIESVLLSRGFSPEEARAYSNNSSAANLAIAQQKEERLTARGNTTADLLAPKYPDLAEAIRSEAMTGSEAAREAWARDKEARQAPSGYRRSEDGTSLEFILAAPPIQRWLFNCAGRDRLAMLHLASASLKMVRDWSRSRRSWRANRRRKCRPYWYRRSFLQDLPSIRQEVAQGGVTGVLDATVGRMGFGQQGRLYARIESGADALQRMLSGAGMPESEAAAYARRYMPSRTDSAEIVDQKLSQMERELGNQMAIVMRGRGGKPGVTPAPIRPPSGTSSSGVKWSVE